VKCKYCGGTFDLKSRAELEVARCANHLDRAAVGLCNDCGDSFCTECLKTYKLATRGEGMTSNLCPKCFAARNSNKVWGLLVVGAIFSLIGLVFLVFNALMFASYGAPHSSYWMLVPIVQVAGFMVPGLGILLYGFHLHSRIIEDAPAKDVGSEGEKDGEASDDIEFNGKAMYAILLRRYGSRFGLSAKEVLDNEIRARIRQGESYEKAVAAVYRSQEKKPPGPFAQRVQR